MKLSSRTAVAAMLAAGSLALAACGGGSETDPAASGGGPAGAAGTLTLGAVNDATSFDPAQSHVGHPMQYYQPVYDSLLRKTPEGELEPMLAEEWEYNENKTELTLELRDDVTFSDGAKFDAAAVKANIDHFKKANGPQASTAVSVSEVKVVDEDTATIVLSAPDPAVEGYLAASLGFMGSPAALGTEEIKTMPVGSGPYTLDKSATVTGSQYTFVKKDGYWDPELQKFDKIVIKPMTDVTARVNAITSGQLDATLLDPKTAPQATGAGKTLLTNPVDWQGLFIFDRAGQQVPALADARVRQAINHAIDREGMLKAILLGQGEVTSQVAGVKSAAYLPELDSKYDYNPEKAKELLAEAGYANGFSLKMPVSSGYDPTIYATLTQQLGAVGITAEQVSVPAADYRNDVIAGKYPIAYYGIFQGDPWVAIGHHIGPNAVFNPLKYTDETSAALIAKVQTGDDQAAKDLNKYITEQAWFAPTYRVYQNYVYDAKKITVENQAQQAVPSIYNYAPAGS